jgi:hypothetical protein
MIDRIVITYTESRLLHRAETEINGTQITGEGVTRDAAENDLMPKIRRVLNLPPGAEILAQEVVHLATHRGEQ